MPFVFDQAHASFRARLPTNRSLGRSLLVRIRLTRGSINRSRYQFLSIVHPRCSIIIICGVAKLLQFCRLQELLYLDAWISGFKKLSTWKFLLLYLHLLDVIHCFGWRSWTFSRPMMLNSLNTFKVSVNHSDSLSNSLGNSVQTALHYGSKVNPKDKNQTMSKIN